MTIRAPAIPPADYRRKPIPAAVKLAAALINGGGIDPAQPYEFDHDPSLGLRPWVPEQHDFEPAELDPHYIVPRQKQAHRVKTAKMDIPAIAKTKRNAKAQTAHREAMAAKGGVQVGLSVADLFNVPAASDRPAKRKRSSWPMNRKIASRPFQRRRKAPPAEAAE